MTPRTRKIVLGAAAVAAAAAGAGGGAAVAAGRDSDTPITGAAYTRAAEAAVAHTGGGRVTGTEVGDEDSYYEVEVRLPDGRQVDVQLDQDFAVVAATADGQPDEQADEGSGG
jgi:hypothetical protein